MSVGGYIGIYLAVYGPEMIGGFGLEEKRQKTKAVCGKDKLWRFAECAIPILDPLKYRTISSFTRVPYLTGENDVFK